MADTGFKGNQGKAEDLKGQAREVGQNLAQKASDVASSVKDKAADVASAARDRAEHAVEAVGDRMTGWAGRLRESAPHEGMIGGAAAAVADRLESSGQYLKNKDFGDIAGDITNLVRNYPIPALLIGVGLGFLVARATSRRA
jgi:ElaB/YqjD/DUF883 family membrane-anchored ribosome-binding protein